VQRAKCGISTVHGVSLLQTGIVQLVVAGRLDQCVLDYRLAHVVVQLALFAVVVNGVVTAAAAAAAAAAVDATRLLCLDEHVIHSLQSESNDLDNTIDFLYICVCV